MAETMTVEAPVRLVGGVRATLNEAQDPFDAQDRAKRLEASLEAQDAEIEQLARGNTGSPESLLAGFVSDAAAFAEDELGEEEPVAEEMGEELLNSIIERELAEGLGSDADDLEGEQAKALDYYFGRPRGDEKSGRSKAQSLDVADMVESVLAQVLPAFTTDLSVQFETLSQEPALVRQAEDESLAVNHVVQKQNNGFLTLYQAIKDALLLRNGAVKVYVQDYREVTVDEIPAMTGEMLALAQQPRTPGETVVLDSYDPETGTARIKRVTRMRKIRIDPIPVDELVINADHDSPCLKTARFVCHRRIIYERDLIEMGYPEDVVRDLPSESDRGDTVPNARAQTAKEWELDQADRTNRPIEVHECWMLVDYDGDGIQERRRILRTPDGTVLDNEVMGYMGIISGTAYINPHKWVGISLYTKLKGVQDIKTHFWRQASDNANVGNNARVGYVKGQVSEDDLFNSKPGGGVAMKRKDAVVPFPFTNTIPAIFEMMGYADKMRTERAGASLDMQSQQIPMQNRTAHGAERVISSMELITALMAETLAKTLVQDVYLAVHHLLRKYGGAGYQMPVDGAMRTTHPGQWPSRDQVTLTKGLSVGERLRQMNALGAVMERQQAILTADPQSTLVSPHTMYQAAVDFAQLAGLPNPQQYWVDPAGAEGQQAQAMRQQQTEQMQRMQQESQQQVIALQRQVIEMQETTKRLVAQLNAQTDQAKIAEDRRQHGEDTANDLTEMELKYNTDIEGARETE